MTTSTFRTAPVTAGHLAYRDTGSGRPLLFLHGGGLDHRMWDDQVSGFATDHRVIAVDARGHGRSSTPTSPFRFCDDVAELITHLRCGPAVLVGVSMGAATAVETALEHPRLVTAVVNSGAGTGEPEFHDPWVHEGLTLFERARTAGDLPSAVDAFQRFVWGPHRAADDVDPEVIRRCREMTTETFQAHGRPDAVPYTPVPGAWGRLADITVPVLGIVGGVDSDDHIRMTERVAEGVHDGRTVTVGGTAHYPNMERPAVFDAALRRFLATL